MPLEQLDKRQKVWIEKLKTEECGYNGVTRNEKNKHFQVQILENDLIFDSQERLCNLFSIVTRWNYSSLSKQIIAAIETGKPFLGYHFCRTECYDESDEDVLIDWIKIVNLRYQGKHYYCSELNREFETIGVAAQYLLDNNLYTTNSYNPMQELITLIGTNVKGKTEAVGDYTFEEIPGASDNLIKLHCPEINKTFDAVEDAAKYFIENKIWKNIKLKTAKSRILDVCYGVFPDYKGYSFSRL